MKPSVLMLLAAAAMPLAACTSMNHDDTLASAGTGAAIGAAGGAGVAAVAGGDLLTGAVIGAAVGGIAGAVWADRDNDGRADGYVRDGQYYAGAPGEYRSAAAPRDCRNVGDTALTGAAVGGAGGAGAGRGGGRHQRPGTARWSVRRSAASPARSGPTPTTTAASTATSAKASYYEGAPTVQPLSRPATAAAERG